MALTVYQPDLTIQSAVIRHISAKFGQDNLPNTLAG